MRMESVPAVEAGAYRHFKGNYYWAFGLALHSETEEPLVVYRALYGDAGLWVRPLSLFTSPVDRAKYPDAAQEMRFEKVPDEEVAGLRAAHPDWFVL